jgi:hypothetical protein
MRPFNMNSLQKAASVTSLFWLYKNRLRDRSPVIRGVVTAVSPRAVQTMR